MIGQPLPIVPVKSNFPLQSSLWQPIKALLAGLLLALGAGSVTPGKAADTLQLNVGPLSQTVQVADLEQFAATGGVPDSLKLYAPLLTPQLREFLQSRIALDPALSLLVLDEVLKSSSGQQVVQTLEKVAPNVSLIELRATLSQRAVSPGGLSLLTVVRALPQESVEINVSALLALVSQVHLAQMENNSLGHVLAQELSMPPAPQGQPQPFLNPAKPGPEAVEMWQLTLRDRNRRRNIPIDLYWSDHTRGPLVVLSHGFGADRRFFAYLAQHLASHGLTVVSVEHPGSSVTSLLVNSTPGATASTDRLLPATEFLDRPKDISFVLNRLAQLNSSSFSLRGRLNTQNVTFIGHSLGGYTGLALAGAPLDIQNLRNFCDTVLPTGLSPVDWFQCAAHDLPVQAAALSDRRITQLIVMNPLIGQLFGTDGLNQVKIPTLMLTSSHDSVTPIADQQLRPFDQLSGPKYLVTVIGGTHLSVGDPQNLNPALSHIPFMPELPDTATTRLREFLQGLSLSFALQQTTQRSQYASFLTPAYAQTYSTAAVPLRLSQDLPPKVQQWLKFTAQRPDHRHDALDYMTSLLHLEAIDIQHRFSTLQQQMVAYLRTSPPSFTAIYLPNSLFRPSLHANQP